MNRIPGILSKPCTLTVNLVALHLGPPPVRGVQILSRRWGSSRGRRIERLVRDMKRNGCSWVAMARAAKAEGLYSATTNDRDIAFTLERNFSGAGYTLNKEAA